MVKTTINLDDIHAKIVKEPIEKYDSTKNMSKILNQRLSKKGKRIVFKARGPCTVECRQRNKKMLGRDQQITTLVDTNVLVYDAIENSPHHVRTSDIIDGSEDLLINSLSIVKLGFVLPRYGIENDGVSAKLDELLHNDYFTVSWISERMLEDVSVFIVENNLGFRNFNSWIIALDAYSGNVPLVIFDKPLSKKCKLMDIDVIA